MKFFWNLHMVCVVVLLLLSPLLSIHTVWAYSYVASSVTGSGESGDDSGDGTSGDWSYSWNYDSSKSANASAGSSASCSCSASSFVSVGGTGTNTTSINKYGWADAWADLVWTWDGPPGEAPGLDCEFDYDGEAVAFADVRVSESTGLEIATVAGGADANLDVDGSGAGVTADAYVTITGRYGLLSRGVTGSISPQLTGDTVTESDQIYWPGWGVHRVTCLVARHSDSAELAAGGTTFTLETGVSCDTVSTAYVGQSSSGVWADSYNVYATAEADTSFVSVTEK